MIKLRNMERKMMKLYLYTKQGFYYNPSFLCKSKMFFTDNIQIRGVGKLVCFLENKAIRNPI